jgi:putative endopeptidase
MRPSLALSILVIFFSSLAFAQSSSSSDSDKPTQLDHFDPKNTDSSVDPCTDFYKYACDKWIANNPIPADEFFWGSFGKLAKWNNEAVHETVVAIAAKPESDRTPVEQKVGDYWAACTNQPQRNATALDTIGPHLKLINDMKSKDDLAAVIADLHRSIPGAANGSDSETFAALFGFSASPDFHNTQRVIPSFDQGGMSLPGRDFYLNSDAKSAEIREKFVAHIQKMFELAGIPTAQAKSDASIVLQMETNMAQVAMDNVKRRDPKNLDNQMDLAAVKKLTPSFNWDQYLSAMQAPESSTYIVTSPDFFRGVEQLIKTQPLSHWQAYLRYQLLSGQAPASNEDFVTEDFNFNGKVLFGAKEIQPLWRRCIQSEDRDIGEALGQTYAARYFPPDSKARMVEMVNNIKAALKADIEAADWMNPETKKQAEIKLAAQLNKIGYPDHWRDYSSLTIKPDNHLANVERSAAFEMDRQMKKIGKPLDRTEWGMTPPTVNAYEDPQTNTINFPAGILQPPFFDPTKDDVVNYAATGAVIGHETIHGYDDQGRKFDENGNLRDWWTDADSKAYDKKGDCIADEYTEDIPELGVKQNGRLTQGENTADNGGIHLALAALQSDLKAKGQSLDDKDAEGFTGWQRFFLAYSNVWCSNWTPEMMRTAILTNPHPLDKYRVNNVLGNMPEFANAFGCKKGQPMVHENACRVW